MSSKTSKKFKEGSQISKLRQYFSPINLKCGKITRKCNVEDCGKDLSATRANNMVSHFFHCHKKIYNEVIMQQRNEKSFKKRRLQFIQNCAEMVAMNGRLFSCLNDSGFLKFVEEEIRELREAGHGVDLDDKSEIKWYISQLADKIKNKIKCDAKGRFISLMVDVGSKNNCSLLGISAQYINNGLVCVRCLGTIELKHSHTALYIKEVITDCLLMFDISIEQVASITTDNGANMLAMIDLFNDDVYYGDDLILESELFNESLTLQISEDDDDGDNVSFLSIVILLAYLHKMKATNLICIRKNKI